MKDELLMRLIDGNISEEDMETIMNEFAGDKELLNEWLIVANASRMADTTPAVNMSKDAALDNVQNIIGKTLTISDYSKSVNKRKYLNLHRWYGVTALAASVLIAVVTILLTTKSERSNYGIDNESFFAQHFGLLDSNDNMEFTPTIRYDNNATINSVINHNFERVSPAQLSVIIESNNLLKNYEFIYKSENVKSAELKIKDVSGELIISKMAVIDKNIKCAISLVELCDREELQWEFCLTFIDDFMLIDQGTIKFVNICE